MASVSPVAAPRTSTTYAQLLAARRADAVAALVAGRAPAARGWSELSQPAPRLRAAGSSSAVHGSPNTRLAPAEKRPQSPRSPQRIARDRTVTRLIFPSRGLGGS